MKYFFKLTIATVLSIIITTKVTAQDRFFARTYTSNVLPKGSIDVEFWHTSRMGRENQYYNAQDQRMEIEFGLGGNLQTSVYYNKYQERFSESNDGTNTSSQIGFSNEWKWKLSDPSLNKIGLALYGEWGLKGGDELELETKIILDKYLNKKTLLAFNTVIEYEKEFDWVNGKLANSVATPLELNFGYQYFIKPNLGIGFELCNFNKITKNNGWEHSVFYGGPTINFRNNRWFIIANYLPQWGNIKKTEFAPSSMVLNEHEKVEARIIVGISL
jgi:hypothetical protein